MIKNKIKKKTFIRNYIYENRMTLNCWTRSIQLYFHGLALSPLPYYIYLFNMFVSNCCCKVFTLRKISGMRHHLVPRRKLWHLKDHMFFSRTVNRLIRVIQNSLRQRRYVLVQGILASQQPRFKSLGLHMGCSWKDYKQISASQWRH